MGKCPPRFAAETSIDHTLVKERFWQRVEKTKDCWVWIGARNDEGYGNFKYKQKSYKAHRMHFIWSNIEIPPKHEIDHLCRNRACVNPDHLEIVTHKENTHRGEVGMHRRSKMPDRLYCKKGHLYDQITRNGFDKFGDPRFHRRCSICNKESCAKNYARLKSLRRG